MLHYGKGAWQGNRERVTVWANSARNSPPPSGEDARVVQRRSAPTFEQAAAKVFAIQCQTWSAKRAPHWAACQAAADGELGAAQGQDAVWDTITNGLATEEIRGICHAR
jgi:hypothetical protein